jgi:predicted RNA-binding Zn ribbon-like protein
MASNRPEPFFFADAVGLDFLNSIATPADEPVEWISSGDDLLEWLEKAGLIGKNVPKAVRECALPGELDAVAAQARALREWFRAFVEAHTGKKLEARSVAELGPLNRVLRRDEQFGQVEVGSRSDPGLHYVTQRRWRSPEALLFPIATAIADVICNEDFGKIRACEGHKCTVFFADHTRGGVRRWCSMAICGNRAKQAAHRERATVRPKDGT